MGTRFPLRRRIADTAVPIDPDEEPEDVSSRLDIG
jgi:hypothetical protein